MFDKTKVTQVLTEFKDEYELDHDFVPPTVYFLIYDICASLHLSVSEALQTIGPFAASFTDLPVYEPPKRRSPAGNLRDLRLLIEEASGEGLGIVVTGLLWEICAAVGIAEDLRPFIIGLTNYDEWMMTQVIL